MSNFEYLRIISAVLVLSVSAVLAFIVFLADTKKTMNRIFFCLVLFSIFWILFSFLGNIIQDPTIALWLKRLNYAMLMPFFVTAFMFSNAFPKAGGKYHKYLECLLMIISTVAFYFSVFTNFIVQSVQTDGWSKNIIGGSGYLIFNSTLLVITLLVFINLFRKYFNSSTNEKGRIKYIIIGASFYAVFNIVFNIVIPLVYKTYQYDFIGDYSILIFIGYTAYAILRHHLFSVKLIAAEVIVVALSLTLFIQVYTSGNVAETVTKIAIWLAATYGGYQLIKSVKHEIRQKEDLAKLAKELEAANSHLKELDKLKDDFLSMAAHELNTPIAAIEGYLSMILDENIGGEVNPKVRKYLENMFTSSKRLALLVHDMLNVSRIESGRIHLIYVNDPIEEIIEQAVAEIGSKAKERKHILVYEKPTKKLPITWYDLTRITEVMINLIGNAIKYTEPGGKIVATASADDKFITVSVKDNGRGIPKEKENSVFEKFTQIDVLKDEVKGTGLGMYISKKFIELHKGKIWFESAGEGKGTTFYFTLPIIDKKPFDPHEGEGEVLH